MCLLCVESFDFLQECRNPKMDTAIVQILFPAALTIHFQVMAPTQVDAKTGVRCIGVTPEKEHVTVFGLVFSNKELATDCLNSLNGLKGSQPGHPGAPNLERNAHRAPFARLPQGSAGHTPGSPRIPRGPVCAWPSLRLAPANCLLEGDPLSLFCKGGCLTLVRRETKDNLLVVCCSFSFFVLWGGEESLILSDTYPTMLETSQSRVPEMSNHQLEAHFECAELILDPTPK